jgi:mitochondrial division protein 1
MTPKMMAHAQTVSARPRAIGTPSTRPGLDFATIGRTPLRLGLGARRTTSRELEIVETASELLAAPLPDVSPDKEMGVPSLLRGFEATVPSADTARVRRRATRNVDAPRLGLKRLSLGARGLMAEEAESEEDVVVVVTRDQRGRHGRKKRGRESLGANKVFGREELERQTREIARDKENLHVRRVRYFPYPRASTQLTVWMTTAGCRVSYTTTSLRLRLRSRRLMGSGLN